MKKILTSILSAAVALSLLTACGGRDSASSLSGTVLTDGSTSMEKVMGALIEGFGEVESGVTVNYSGTGSGSGIQAVLSGTCDIGLSSRALKQSEAEKGAVGHIVALDGIAIVVNRENPISDLSAADIAAIFTGEVTNWSQLGGDDAPVAVYGREAGSGTRSAFEEILGVEDSCRYTNEYSSTGDIIGNVASNPNGIGYVSLSSVNDSVKALSVEGAACTEDAIRDGSYTIQRPFLLVTREDAELSQAAQAFLDYALSDEVAEYISIAGAVAP